MMLDFEGFKALSYQRRSMRALLPDPIDDSEIKNIFEAAQYAPSNCNTQPWQVVVVSGDKLNTLKQRLLETIGQGQFQLDFPFDDALYKEEFKARQIGAAKAYNNAVNVDRGDPNRHLDFLKKNLECYGASHAAFIFMPDWCGVREACDVGMFAQNLMLAMRAKNIGSCPQTLLGFNADVVRQQLGIDNHLKLIFGISFGYFDSENPANQVRTERADFSDAVRFYS